MSQEPWGFTMIPSIRAPPTINYPNQPTQPSPPVVHHTQLHYPYLQHIKLTYDVPNFPAIQNIEIPTGHLFSYDFKHEYDTVLRIEEEKRQEQAALAQEERDRLAKVQEDAFAKVMNEKKTKTTAKPVVAPNTGSVPKPFLVDLDFNHPKTTDPVPAPVAVPKKVMLPPNAVALPAMIPVKNNTNPNPAPNPVPQPTTVVAPNPSPSPVPKPPPKPLESSPKMPFSDAKKNQVYKSLLSSGFGGDISELAINLFGTSDEIKLITFITAYTQLSSHKAKFTPEKIKKALLIYESDVDKATEFLLAAQEVNQLKFDDEFLLDTIKAFKDTQKAKNYCVGFHRLRELGLYTDEKIRDALMKGNLDIPKAYEILNS